MATNRVSPRLVVLLEREQPDGSIDELEVELPSQWCICDHCRGSGGSSSYLGAFTSEEWHQQDEDFRRDYMAGAYDRPCDACGGSGKVLVLDEAADLTPLQKEAVAYREELARDAAEERAIMRAEARLMGDY